MQLANGFSNKAYQYALGDANEFTPHNFAELMKKKIPPKFVGKTPEPQPYEEYLNVLNDYNRASQTVRKAWMALATIDIEGTAGEAKVVEELGTVLANVDPKMMSKFQSESQAAANGIERTKYPLPQKPASYLKDFKNKNYQYSSFPRARAIQLNEDIPKVPVDSDFSTVEEVIHALPPDLDLTTELYRYSLIKDFEDILLDNVRPNAEKILQTAAKQQIEESLKTPSLLEKSINSYISKLGEDDYVRFFGEPPASVYTKLAKSATPKEKILHALENYENLLHEADYNKLREASTSSDPRINFKRALNLIKQAQERQEPKLDSYIKILKEFEGQALNQRGTNYPYLDELFHRHMIDDATYAKLNSPEMNPTAFHDVLGTRPQFTKTLMDQFRKRLEAESLEQVAQNNLPDAAITHLTHSYFEQLDSQAKKFYLTTNAFTKPNSMKFGEAIRVYDESSLRKLHSLPPDSDLVAKSLVEAHLPEAPPADELEVFLNEVHLTGHSPRNYEVDHPILKDNQFPSIDFRLREFFEKPLLKDDARLIGTRYAHMSDAARQSLNAAANALFQDYEKLIEAAKSGDNLKKKIAVLEGQLREDIPPMLEIMSFIEHNKKIGNVLGG
ncbi:hypothetical protein VP01_2036g4 [Puccinia sorghi]|uniref:Uncharacterized protein n=1 Tax=Puccinia sorghi TaxID=27349 RepID=A0A0L6VB31_9BASI|nr:hypothetical protein VP01_2036g4 [Puccinia sorghi]